MSIWTLLSKLSLLLVRSFCLKVFPVIYPPWSLFSLVVMVIAHVFVSFSYPPILLLPSSFHYFSFFLPFLPSPFFSVFPSPFPSLLSSLSSLSFPHCLSLLPSFLSFKCLSLLPPRSFIALAFPPPPPPPPLPLFSWPLPVF